MIAAVEGPRNRLLAYIASNLGFIAANKRYVAAMTDVVLNLRDAEGQLKFTYAEGADEILRPLIDMLREGQRDGVFGDFDPMLMAKSIRDAIDGTAGRAIQESDFDVRKYAAHLCRLFDLATSTQGE
ncbi:MAG: TetR family transcriptional regulator [Nocardia sp.]|uniref:hypothetical protein n=1 Tax=Nocardia sp. TaxID=1821 RepID=UPI002624207D|nr:hypothetical protein [Nocardia sp.]MCU1643124.1 TetR family transcriptional regulator [Nocardia sp.]